MEQFLFYNLVLAKNTCFNLNKKNYNTNSEGKLNNFSLVFFTKGKQNKARINYFKFKNICLFFFVYFIILLVVENNYLILIFVHFYVLALNIIIFVMLLLEMDSFLA